jgi:opacity protein-like surface antigen
MLRIRCLLVVAALGALSAARPAAAQVIPSPYRHVETKQSLNLFGGYPLTDEGKLELGPRSRALAGLRYTIRLGGPFSAEASATYFPSTRAVYDTVPAASGARRFVGDANLDLAMAAASLRFDLTGPRTYHNLMPYLLFGGGVAFDASRNQAIDAEVKPDVRFDFGTRFAGHVGAGIEWFATRRVGLRADARDVFWKLRTPKAFLTPDTPESQWVQNFAFSLGLAYYF